MTDKQDKELRLLKHRISELKANRLTYCAYCGEEFPIDAEGTPEAVSQHILTCEKHPIRQLRGEHKVEIQKAVTAERERIIEYLESMAWVFNPGKEKPEFLGILKELKSGIWEGKVPPESTLKVLVDGEWLEASDEFKKTVTDIDQALSGGN